MVLNWLDVGFGVACIHALGIIAAIHAVLTVRTSQGAVAWAVSLVTMPYLTLIPYLFLGRSKFVGYVEARRARNEALQSRMGEIQWTGEPPVATDAHPEFAALTAMTRMSFVAGNHVRLLVNGHATFDAVFAAIDRARDYILVQFFIVKDDALGRALAARLLARAATGVKVYFLYDRIGSHDLPRSYCEKLRQGGVLAHEFAAARRGIVVNRFQLNFRNHRKIVVVDGDEAFIGGHNVGVEYLGEKPPLAPWRDTHISVRGPAVVGIQRAFAEDWHWSTGTVPELNRQPAPSGGDMHCQVVPSGPADQLETSSLFFVTAINAAQKRVWLTTPYFVPDEAVFSALRLAVLRGVDVRLLIPDRADHYVVFEATTSYAFEATRSGIQVYRYRHGFLHQKVVLIDDSAAAVGSANLDNRSFRLNFELMLLVVDGTFAQDVAAMLANDFEHAALLNKDDFRKTARWRQIVMRVARLFAPIL
ncbi:cardiolipin synthase [Pandoraea pulmonicola]|uniref:Cardiolipin synthase A n=1 Tax=Pandoraea pulmonicola TaxID=93221 RepID=A0AAJ4Z8M9_PANPU|nr:cardiolipin synthase [Pandoraea pulmonicola]AJC22159.1 cardiolipin synthase [Pandoraea pulmonicola]SUA88809.1 Cardiolipin synthase [Pandoraea pulmonicola]